MSLDGRLDVFAKVSIECSRREFAAPSAVNGATRRAGQHPLFALTTATGSASFSMTTSAPARPCSSPTQSPSQLPPDTWITFLPRMIIPPNSTCCLLEPIPPA